VILRRALGGWRLAVDSPRGPPLRSHQPGNARAKWPSGFVDSVSSVDGVASPRLMPPLVRRNRRGVFVFVNPDW